jgi:hypothetical protein
MYGPSQYLIVGMKDHFGNEGIRILLQMNSCKFLSFLETTPFLGLKMGLWYKNRESIPLFSPKMILEIV